MILLCDKPPAGWYCTRGAGHTGPCAAHQHDVRDDHTTAEAIVWAAAYAGWLSLVRPSQDQTLMHRDAADRANAAVMSWREVRT